MTEVELLSVAKAYGSTEVLTDISVRFAPGSFTSLLGPSGSGKTTLLRIVAGFVAPDRGVVAIGGRDVTHVPVWARNIGMVFQSYALFPHMTVAANVAFGLERRGVGSAEAKLQVGQALELVRLQGLGDRRPKHLSGGQQQRVALARAIVTRPSVLLLDEPLSALDRRLRQEMQVELVRIQRESGLTTIFVTHDQEEALTLSDQLAILDRGRIVQMGAPRDVYEHPRTRFAAEFLGDTNFMSGVVVDGTVALPGGLLLSTDQPLPANGTRVTLAVRPEKIVIGTPAASADGRSNRLRATIVSVIYGGTSVTYVVEVARMTLKVFSQNLDGRPLEAGSSVDLSWSPAHTVLVEESM